MPAEPPWLRRGRHYAGIRAQADEAHPRRFCRHRRTRNGRRTSRIDAAGSGDSGPVRQEGRARGDEPEMAERQQVSVRAEGIRRRRCLQEPVRFRRLRRYLLRYAVGATPAGGVARTPWRQDRARGSDERADRGRMLGAGGGEREVPVAVHAARELLLWRNGAAWAAPRQARHARRDRARRGRVHPRPAAHVQDGMGGGTTRT